MYQTPHVCAVNDQACRSDPDNALHVFGSLGSNSGNMAFSEAIYRGIKGARRGIYAFAEEELEGADCIVLAAANWMNSVDDFGWLADRLEASGLPVITVGLGAQADLDRSHPVLQPGTLRLIRLLAERSPAISVRGDFSAEVLAQHGIHNVLVTGCPSALLIGRVHPFLNRTSVISDHGCAIHASRNLFDAGKPLERFLYRQAIRRQIPVLLQAEQPDILFKLNAPPAPDEVRFHHQVLTWAYGADIASVHSYLASQAQFIPDYDAWIRYLSTRQFVIGTRLHGTIASLIAGTPATLITHDSRTAEAALAMHLPTVDSARIDLDRPLRMEDYYDDAAYSRFERHYPVYLRNFQFFFHLNGLEMFAPT